MKKLVLTMVALVAMATASYAQFTVYKSCSTPRYNTHSASYSTPRVTYNVPTTTVRGYYRSNGTYVQPHVRTMPNTTNWDNFSTSGNSNPFADITGYRARDYSLDALNYGTGHTIYTGPKGGQYYYNDSGYKTYVPKQPW